MVASWRSLILGIGIGKFLFESEPNPAAGPNREAGSGVDDSLEPLLTTAGILANALAKCNSKVYYRSMSTVLNDADAKRQIAFHVNRFLKKRGFSRYWLAKETGEWQSTIANVCNGECVPGAGLLARIADALETTTDELLKPIPKTLRKSRISA